MALYLLDSDIIIDYLRGTQPVVRLVQQLVIQRDLLYITSVNVTEVLAGMRAAEQTATETLLAALPFKPVDFTAATAAGMYLNTFRKRGITLALSDATIAAVARENQFVLVTRNKRHYPMDDIVLYPAL